MGGDTSNQGESREINGNQGKSMGIKGNQGESRGVKGSQGKSREIKGNQGESRGSMRTEEKRDEIRDPGKQQGRGTRVSL